MVHWLTCVLTGRHSYSPWCENGSMFLRCTNCGRRTPGWQVSGTPAGRQHVIDATAHRHPAPRIAALSVVNSE